MHGPTMSGKRSFPASVATQRLVLRRPSATFAPALWRAIDESHDHLRDYVFWLRDKPTLATVEEWLREEEVEERKENFNSNLRYYLFLRKDGRCIGRINHMKKSDCGRKTSDGKPYEVAVPSAWLHKDFTGQKYLDEAYEPLTPLLMEQDFCQALEAGVEPGNHHSLRRARRDGFVEDRRGAIELGGAMKDMIFMILRLPNHPDYKKPAAKL